MNETEIVKAFESYFRGSNWMCINVFGPKCTGKSLFLKAALRCCGINNEIYRIEDEKDGIIDLINSDDENYCKYPVVFLDFSDFTGTSYEDFLCYMRMKMSELYIRMIKDILAEDDSYQTWNQYLDVVDGSCTESDLVRSLLELVHLIRYKYSWKRKSGICSNRPLILIDGISSLLLYGVYNDYVGEVKEFLDIFLEIDHYELTAGIITTSYAPLNTDVSYDFKYISNIPVNDIEPLKLYISSKNPTLKLEKTDEVRGFFGISYFPLQIDLPGCLERMIKEYGIDTVVLSDKEYGETKYGIYLSQDLRNLISEKRIWIANMRKAYEIAELEKKERERREYAKGLPDNCIIPSMFAGIRELKIDVTDQRRYEVLTEMLRGFYDSSGKDISLHDVYDCIQGYNRNGKKNEHVTSTLQLLKEYADSVIAVHRCWIDINDSYWGRIDIERVEDEEGYSDMALIKVYISVSDAEMIVAVFEDVIRYLLDNGEHLFHAKVSRYERNDHICLWVGKEDFLQLEKYIQKYDDILITPLPFVAYRGKLGISREFYSWESHNGVQAGLICTYLNTVDTRENIDLLEMYRLFVRGWNGDLNDEHLFTKEYKRENAQALLILLESINVILGNTEITDDHLLLNGDGDLWYALGSSKNWYEVGKKVIRNQ